MKVVEIQNLTKKFGEFVANDNISLHANEGEILAIVGKNGAGKSPMNMLLVFKTYKWSYPCSRKVDFKSPTDAIEAGIGVVPPLSYCSLSVSDNIFLGRKNKEIKLKNKSLNTFIDMKDSN